MCKIQEWTGVGTTIVTSNWTFTSSTTVDASVACYSLAGRVEAGGAVVLYVSTCSAASSKVYRIDAATKAVRVVKTAAANTIYRSVANPPQPRANYTCPQGFYGTTYDLACAYDCCEPCTSACPAGQVLVQTCSFDSDNLCLSTGAYANLAASLRRGTRRVLAGLSAEAGGAESEEEEEAVGSGDLKAAMMLAAQQAEAAAAAAAGR